MLFPTEYFIFLWLLPVTVFIILPLTASVVWSVIFSLKEFTAGRLPFGRKPADGRYNQDNALQPSSV